MTSFQAGLGHVTDEKADLGQLTVKHYRDLDGLRGILALCVVLMHFGFNNFIYRNTGFPGFAFSLCVDAFFLLSGFVLTASYRPDKSFKTFALKRFFRLGPVFYATTLVALAVTPDLNPRLAPLELAMAVPFAGKYPANFPAWSITWEF